VLDVLFPGSTFVALTSSPGLVVTLEVSTFVAFTFSPGSPVWVLSCPGGEVVGSCLGSAFYLSDL
jgi:hypothetical protein